MLSKLIFYITLVITLFTFNVLDFFVFFVLMSNVPLQIGIGIKIYATCGACILFVSVMDSLHMMSKLPWYPRCIITWWALVIYSFLMDNLYVTLQILISTKCMSTFFTFIILDSVMSNLHMSSKVRLVRKHAITLATLDVLDFFMESLCVGIQILPCACFMITQRTFEIFFLRMHYLLVTVYTMLVFCGELALAVRTRVVRVLEWSTDLGHVALLLSPLAETELSRKICFCFRPSSKLCSRNSDSENNNTEQYHNLGVHRISCKHLQPRQTDCLSPVQIWTGIKQSVCLGCLSVDWFGRNLVDFSPCPKPKPHHCSRQIGPLTDAKKCVRPGQLLKANYGNLNTARPGPRCLLAIIYLACW